VIDVTNFSPKTDVFGSRENLHLVERYTRTGPKTLAYEAMIEDPTVWTRAWTVKQEFTKQSDAENRIYYEPRCIEGNYGLPGLLHGRRVEERAFAEGRGPDPKNQGQRRRQLVSSAGSVAVALLKSEKPLGLRLPSVPLALAGVQFSPWEKRWHLLSLLECRLCLNRWQVGELMSESGHERLCR
jgi:hypothetical protein